MGPWSKVLFITNLTGLGTQQFYEALHDWITDFEGVMHAVIAIPHPHGSANIHVHFETHGEARGCKYWFDDFLRLTKHLRHAPAYRLGCKFAGYCPATCPPELAISQSSPWSHPLMLASWDANVIHPYPCPIPPCPFEHELGAWDDLYLYWCNLCQAPPGLLGAPGTHQAKWTDPNTHRGRAHSMPRSRNATPTR